MIIYYIEVNLICAVILALFLIQWKNMDTSSSDQRILKYLIWATILICFSDMFAGILRGRTFAGARALIEISNLAYFEGITLVSFLWYLYVHVRITKSYTYNRTRLLLQSLPFLLFSIIDLTNPLTHILFRVNSENLYERNAGVYIHWVIVWMYFLIPSIKTLYLYTHEKSRLKKTEIAPMLYFTIAPFIASLAQMFFYGITTTQVGITISIVMICLACQDTQILTDALTGINNRRGLDYYLANSMQHNSHTIYTLIMIDVDRFKQINDQYGHMMGDQVLCKIAEALKQSCKVVSNRLHLCRFGGDEFVILGVDCKEEEITKLKKAILYEIKANLKKHNLPENITVSIGTAATQCKDENDIKELIKTADQAMYQEKQKSNHN